MTKNMSTIVIASPMRIVLSPGTHQGALSWFPRSRFSRAKGCRAPAQDRRLWQSTINRSSAGEGTRGSRRCRGRCRYPFFLEFIHGRLRTGAPCSTSKNMYIHCQYSNMTMSSDNSVFYPHSTGYRCVTSFAKRLASTAYTNTDED